MTLVDVESAQVVSIKLGANFSPPALNIVNSIYLLRSRYLVQTLSKKRFLFLARASAPGIAGLSFSGGGYRVLAGVARRHRRGDVGTARYNPIYHQPHLGFQGCTR